MIFNGQELPPLRQGNVWTMQIFPGGRKVVVQVKPYRVSTVAAAVEKLKGGHRVHVALDDAIRVLTQVRLPSTA